VTELYRLLAATAAERWGLAPCLTHLDRTSFPVDGRYHSDEEPDAQVIHMTRGYRRDHRPDLNQVMLELMVEHHAGIPLLMKPLSGHSSEAHSFGELVRTPMDQRHTPYGLTSLVADRALYREANRAQLSQTQMKWLTRVPAPVSEAQAALAQVNPQTMMPRSEGYRCQMLHSTYGSVAQRWALLDSEPRQPQAQRTADRPWLKQSAQDLNACHKLCRTAFACAADAQQALRAFEQGLQVTQCTQLTIRPVAYYGTRGRPGPGASPARVVYQVEGALASSLAARQARSIQQSCFLLATHELDDQQLPPQVLLDAYKGPSHAERGVRFLKDPQFLASSLYLKKPERMMARLMIMTVCLLVYAALAYRIRTALKDHGAMFPDQKGKPTPTPTARWVFHDFVGIPLLFIPHQWPIVINLTEEHQRLLPFLRDRYAWFYR
jgi:transposase